MPITPVLLRYGGQPNSTGIIFVAPLTMLILHNYGQRRQTAWRNIELSGLYR